MVCGLLVRKMFHSCDACLLGKFDECTMESEIGKMLRQPKGSPAKHGALSRSQALRLQDFGDQIDKDWLLAVDVDPTQHIVEGIYWLARATGPAFLIAEDTVHSGQQYRAGWLVVPARWYMLRQKSERGYELLSPIVWLVVNHCIRLKGLAFRGSQSGPQRRELRPNTTGPYAEYRATGSGLSFLDEETHNEIIMACEYADPDEDDTGAGGQVDVIDIPPEITTATRQG